MIDRFASHYNAQVPRLNFKFGIIDCPTSPPPPPPLVKSSLEGARRKLAGPVQPKGPLSVDTVCRISSLLFQFLFL